MAAIDLVVVLSAVFWLEVVVVVGPLHLCQPPMAHHSCVHFFAEIENHLQLQLLDAWRARWVEWQREKDEKAKARARLVQSEYLSPVSVCSRKFHSGSAENFD